VDAPLGVWLDDRHELDGGKIAESELYGSAGLQLFKEKAGAKTHRVSDFGGPDAVLRVVATRMLRRDGTPRPAEHIFQRCQQNDGICVQEALAQSFSTGMVSGDSTRRRICGTIWPVVIGN
jgi:hypothetical protein